MKRKGKYLKAQEQIEKDKMALQAFVNENLGGKFKRDMDAVSRTQVLGLR